MQNMTSFVYNFREKEKWDAKEKKLSETICHRDGIIDELKRSAAQQSEQMSELITRLTI